MAVAIPAEMIAIISAMHRPKWARAPGRLDNKDPVAGHAVPTGHSFTTSMPLLDPLTLTCGIAGSAIRSASSALRPSSSQHAQHGKTISTGKQVCVLDRAGLVDVTAEQIFVSRSDEAATAALRAISMHVLHRCAGTELCGILSAIRERVSHCAHGSRHDAHPEVMATFVRKTRKNPVFGVYTVSMLPKICDD